MFQKDKGRKEWRMKITIKEAYYAMFYLLDKYYDEKQNDDLGAILGSMNPTIFSDDMPADAALWSEWIAIVKKIVSCERADECLDTNQAFQAMVAFLSYYKKEFGVRIEEVIEDLTSNKLNSRDLGAMWQESIKQALIASE